MRCDRYEEYELGKIGEEDFRQHLERCSICQKRAEEDARLMGLAKSLKQPVNAPWLWTRIQSRLEEEQRRAEKPGIRFLGKAVPVLRFAVVLVVGIALGVVFWPRSENGESRLLADSSIEKVEKREKAYMDAIVELEKKAQPKMAEMDIELALLYRDRLETIDAQIERCKEALVENPANAHIRRYMLTALQDKKETLKEILQTSTFPKSQHS